MRARIPGSKTRIVELAAILVVVFATILICLPMFSRAREASRRASCQNNLKQIGIVLRMYASESRGEFLPPLSPIIDNWMFDLRLVYPEYLADLNVLVCPQSPFSKPGLFDSARQTGSRSMDPECVSSLFYIYTGYAIFSDEQAKGLFDAYMIAPHSVIAGNILEVLVPVWPDSTRITGSPGYSGIPVVWDRVPLGEDEFSHTPAGINVLHFDGHVEFIKYSHYNSSNYFPATRAGAETFGSVMPVLPAHCIGFWR
ncbi:MAG: DUF1559 domain-containing protein [Candidatus Hydrogenedentes bacterium]|nr:DUF1559 domain-containing protein [Candidatus Hydrogenedentota bacterium]